MQTKSNPQLIVIAGPNGSGKSTTSKKLLEPFGIVAFDWDQRFHDKWSEYGFDPLVAEGIRDTVNLGFQQHIESALSNQGSLAYETNFHTHYNLELAKAARKQGYQTSLYFLALTHAELGIERVAQRVLHGGHHVSEQTIRERYESGMKMLDSEAVLFYDSIMIYNSSDQFRIQIVIEERKLVHQADKLEMGIINKLPNLKLMLG